ncbi:RNA 2',3'-cyclic phosphodiesterase [Desmospora activa]|uniref:RNA 2',3'-cyclic phosphodiesterase n=1 Tax=Desmospora activa DSM 45169 TaxID=1121389 RepID=A0A2T4Z6V1_9BACL|nr:RNA 2',3'-cyclic phosphodiesterase [Desmospora activa]PTM57608.1 2'-5' RNA ligase [Desmospora activa DSM 45169]
MSSRSLYRLFIAVPVPDPHRQWMAEWCRERSEQWPFKKWVHPSDYHITVQFLGECTFRQAREVKKRVRLLMTEMEPFSLSLGPIGWFGVADHPRILWAGLDGDLDRLHQLYQAVADTVSPVGFAKEKRLYRPHITIAKKYKRNDFPHEEVDTTFRPESAGLKPWTVDELILYQTHVYRSPMYQPLAIFGVGAG